MSGFAQYYVGFLQDLWKNIGEWFLRHISIIVKIFYGDWWDTGGYFDEFPTVRHAGCHRPPLQLHG